MDSTCDEIRYRGLLYQKPKIPGITVLYNQLYFIYNADYSIQFFLTRRAWNTYMFFFYDAFFPQSEDVP